MKFNPRSRLVLGGTVAVALLAVLVYLISLPKGQKTIIVASGVEGLTFGRLGEQLVWSLSEIQGNPLNIPSPKETAGSSDNLQALLNSDETIGFVSSATLQQEMSVDPEIGDRVRVLATLYQDQLQLVVRTNIDNIRQLAGKGVYMGKAGSTTETVSANILSNFDIRYKKEDEDTADAAFFLAGTPADHIVEALKDGSRKLLDFGEDVAQIKLATGLSESSIRPFTYQNQSKTIRTVQDDIYLLSNSSFPDDLAYMVVKVMFDDVDRLQIAQHIRLQKVLLSENLPPNIRLHPGVEEFKHDERKTLYIAAAGINDKYWDYGITLRKMLGQRGIQSRVIPTDGSLENLNILESGEQPAIALVQYDTALAAHTGDPQYIYDLPGHTNRPTQITVSGMRRIATLHKEKLHIMYRSDQKGQSTNARFLESENWPSLSVCTGPIESGTRMVAESVLRLSDFEPGTTTELPVNLMVERIFDGSIDVGFYMGNVPNAAIKTLLGSGTANLLNVESLAIAQLGGQVFSQQFIDDPIYRNTRTISGGGGAIHQPVETIGTRAVLVTTADLPFDVTKITRCIFEGADTLGLTTNEMAMDLAIPLHSDALSHYREMEYPGYSKPEPLINSLANSWWNPFYGLENTLKSWGMRAATSETVARGLAIITATLLGILINFFTKNLILAGLKKAWNHAETKWDAIFIDKKVLNLLSYLAAAVVMYALIAVAMIKNESAYWPERLITSTLLIYMLVIAVMIFNCLINGALAIYRTFPISREVPLRGVVQLLKIAVYGLATTLWSPSSFKRVQSIC